jgi:hypothetical protein
MPEWETHGIGLRWKTQRKASPVNKLSRVGEEENGAWFKLI